MGFFSNSDDAVAAARKRLEQHLAAAAKRLQRHDAAAADDKVKSEAAKKKLEDMRSNGADPAAILAARDEAYLADGKIGPNAEKRAKIVRDDDHIRKRLDAELIDAAAREALKLGRVYSPGHRDTSANVAAYVEAINVLNSLPGGAKIAAEMPRCIPTTYNQSEARFGRVAARFELLDRFDHKLNMVEAMLSEKAGAA